MNTEGITVMMNITEVQNSRTPVLQISDDDNLIFIKREDFLPFSFGGNKVRIALEFLDDMKQQGAGCIVGYGGIKSNLNRALANICSRERIPCHLIVSSDTPEKEAESFNSLMASSFGARFYFCRKSEVKETIDKVLSSLRNDGLVPYYIYGDSSGAGNEHIPLRAYEKVYREIRNRYDYIFLATGTGMTQAGLLAGKALCRGNEKIIGISVARTSLQESAVIRKYLLCYSERTRKIDIPESNVDDSCLCGGYGLYNTGIEETIRYQMNTNGIPLDPVYTGKAFWGMQEYLKRNRIQGKKVLFIHTGGSPLFFDYYLSKTSERKIENL